MPRVNTVKRSRKPLSCGKCGDKIPKGSAYRWWKFNFSHGKHVRCMKPECSPKGSDLTQSEYLGRVSDIQSFEFTGTNADDLQSEMEDIKGQIEELRDEQEEKRNNMPDSLQESDTGQLLQDRYDNCDNVVNELDSVSIEEFDEEEATVEVKKELPKATAKEIAAAVEEKKEQHYQTIRDELSSALGNLE